MFRKSPGIQYNRQSDILFQETIPFNEFNSFSNKHLPCYSIGGKGRKQQHFEAVLSSNNARKPVLSVMQPFTLHSTATYCCIRNFNCLSFAQSIRNFPLEFSSGTKP
jgi:hypothetical protein